MSPDSHFSLAPFSVRLTVVAVLVAFDSSTAFVVTQAHRNAPVHNSTLDEPLQALHTREIMFPLASVAAVRANGAPLYLLAPLPSRVTNQSVFGTTPGERHLYLLTEHLPWVEAEALAQELGGHLVTLDSWQEELWIKDTFGENELFWIGHNDIEVEGHWVWSSGVPVTYTNWAPGEPNDCGGPGPGCAPEDAAAMNWCAEGGLIKDPCLGDHWNDLSIDAHLKGVVEIERITICHQPGSRAERTLEIPIQALDGHLRHGDTIGPCQ